MYLRTKSNNVKVMEEDKKISVDNNEKSQVAEATCRLSVLKKERKRAHSGEFF